MLYRLLFGLFIFLPISLWAATKPEPLFVRYTKTYDAKNKRNLKKRQVHTPGKNLEVPKPILEDNSVAEDLAPDLSPKVEKNIVAWQKRQPLYSSEPNLLDESNQHQLDDIRSDIVKNYLDNQVLNGFLIKRIKAANPSISSMEKGIKKAGDFSKSPTSAPEPVVEEIPTESPEETWNIESGAKFDLLRQRGRTWFYCDLFKSEAKVKFTSNLNYQVKLYKDLELSDDQYSPFGVIQTAVEVNQDETLGVVKTNLSQNVELNYTSIINRNDNAIQFQYLFEF